jgi:hypothetical protein
MRRAPITIVLAVLIGLVALAFATGSTAAKPKAAAVGSAPVTSSELVCPNVNGVPASTTSRAAVADISGAMTPPTQSKGAVAATLLAGSKSKTTVLHTPPAVALGSVAKLSHTYQISASGSVAATLAADTVTETTSGRYRGLLGMRCQAPATDWWFSGADGRIGFTDMLLIANPSPAPATVAVSTWGAKGPVNNQLDALRIPARSTTRVSVASIAPDVASVGVRVHATSGSVVATIVDHRSKGINSLGGDVIPSVAAPFTSGVIPGFPAGRGPRYLIMTAPYDRDATVSLRLVTKSGSFAPSGINQVVVRAGHSKVVSLARPLAQSPGAVELQSDQPVIASGLSVTLESGGRPDIMWLGVSPPIQGSAAIADGKQPDGGHTILYLSAPLGAAQVRVTAPSGTTMTVSIPAGKTVAAEISKTVHEPSGPQPFVVTPVGAAPVYGIRALYLAGAHGALITGEPLIGLPKPIPLPPVREDPRVATR